MNKSEDLDQLGIFDQNTNSIKLIEWAEIIKKKPENRLEIYLNFGKTDSERNLEFKGFGGWKGFDAS